MLRGNLLPILASIGLAAAVSAFPVGAAKPQAALCSSATLTGTNDAGDGSTVISPGQPFEVDGCGFKAGQAVQLEVYEHGDFICRCPITADGQGRFAYSGTTQWGAYRFRAYTERRNKQWDMAAEWWFGAY